MLAEAATAASSKSDVIAAIRQASAQTGSDFSYMLGTAMRESGLKTQAKSASSSATGLYQFVDQTWLGLVKQHGAQFGLGSYAAQISRGSDGHFHVADSADRQAILALRKDPKTAALMEGEYCNSAKCTMESALGHSVSNGDLYAAHFLGAESATRLIQLNARNPGASAAAAFPAAAGANRSVFYHADGSAKSVHEVYAWATKQTGDEVVPTSDVVPTKPVSYNTAYAGDDAVSSDWAAMRMYSGGSSPLVPMTDLPQAPFVLTPGVMDILSSLTPDNDDANKSQSLFN
ncbi:MAG: hypothetical protein WBQ17_01265 [Rhizomicrobium sp.]